MYTVATHQDGKRGENESARPGCPRITPWRGGTGRNVPPSVNTATDSTDYLFPNDQGGTDGTTPTASHRPQIVNGI
jgi:hypothetical protein